MESLRRSLRAHADSESEGVRPLCNAISGFWVDSWHNYMARLSRQANAIPHFKGQELPTARIKRSEEVIAVFEGSTIRTPRRVKEKGGEKKTLVLNGS